MVCFRGVTKMYAAGKHFVEVNKMVTAEVLRPAGAARSKGLGCCPTSSCNARGRVYTGPLLAGTMSSMKQKQFHQRRLYGCADFQNIVILKY